MSCAITQARTFAHEHHGLVRRVAVVPEQPWQPPRAVEDRVVCELAGLLGHVVDDVSPRRPLRVLGCEDNAIARKLLAALLKQKGYEFVAANDGQKGVDAFKEFRPDVTVMDIGMPVKDGIQASHEIREIEAERGWTRHKIVRPSSSLARCPLWARAGSRARC